jgi:hypothetical protein
MGVGTIVTVNRVLSLWDRTAVRRAGYAIAAIVFFAGTVAYLNVRSEDSAAPAKVVPGTDAQKYGAKIPLPKDAVGVGKKFIDDAVLRKDLADGWALSTPTVHADLTRSQWETGSIPVQPFDASAYDGTSFRVVRSREKSVLLLLLISSSSPDVKSGEFFMELVPAGDGWKVNYFGPRGTNPPVPAQRP